MKYSRNTILKITHFYLLSFLIFLVILGFFPGATWANDLPENFPAVKVECFSSSDSAGLISSDPTLDGGWYRPRRDKGLTAQSPLIGGIECPEVLWGLDISDHGMWLELKPGGGPETVEATTEELGDFWYTHSEYNKAGEIVSLNGWQEQESGSSHKIGNFLESVEGFERISCDPYANDSDPDNGTPGSCFMYRWDGNAWVEVWKSDPLPQMTSGTGGRVKPVIADIDNDGELEVAVSPWYLVHILDLKTGVLENTGQFTNPDGEMSGRPYGWQGVFNLDDDPRMEVVILADFLPTVQVLGWNAQGEFVELWDRIIEPTIQMNNNILMSTAKSVSDIDGDGVPEVLLSVFNENSDHKWHLLVLDGDTGHERLNLADRYLAGAWDLNGDGTAELLINETTGQLLKESGPAIVGSMKGGTFTELKRLENEGFQWSNLKSFPDNVNSGTSLFKLHPTVLENWQGGSNVFVTTSQLENDTTRLTLWSTNGVSIENVGTITGSNLSVLGSKHRDGSDKFLVRSTINEQMSSDIELQNLSLHALHSSRLVSATGPLAAGKSLLTGTVAVPRLDNTPLFVTEGFGQTLRAFSVEPGQTNPALQWGSLGRGMSSGSGLIALEPHSQAMASIAAFKPNGDGQFHFAAARRSSQTGGAAMAVFRPNGTLLWEQDIEVLAEPPVWNLSGITHWLGANFRSAEQQDLYVVARRSNASTEQGMLLDGRTGSPIWSKTAGAVYGACGTQGGPNPYLASVFDWDGDGLDDIADHANSTFAIYKGNTGETLMNKTTWPGCDNAEDQLLFGADISMWGNGYIGIAAEIRPEVEKVLMGGSAGTLASFSVDGELDWYTEPYSGMPDSTFPQTADLDGDGELEIVVVGHCDSSNSEIRAYNSLDGSLRWGLAKPDICDGPGVQAPAAGDLDGDGRDEVIFAQKNTLYAIAESNGQPQIRWQATFGDDDWWLDRLGSPVIADVEGLGHPQILVNTSGGRLLSFGSQNTQPVFEASGLSGTWYDPASSGQGFNFQMTNQGLLVFYFGHKDPNKRSAGNLWLISGLAPDQIKFNKPVELTMYERPNGVFGNPNVEGTDNNVIEWGKLTIEFSHCSTGRATLDGADGKQEFDLVRLAPVDGVECTDGTLASSVSAISGTWWEPATDGQGFNIQLTPFGLFGYFYGYSAAVEGEMTGSPQWLISDLLPGSVTLGESYEIAMFSANSGTYSSPNPSLTGWGAMTLKFDSCETGSVKLSGVDGETTMALQILAPIAGLACE